MSGGDTDIRKFLRAVRYRLWLEAVLDQTRISAWFISGTFVVLAIVRLSWGGVDPGAALVAAASCGILVLLPALIFPPGLTHCAIRADRHFDGHSLMTTASELDRGAASRPAERAVMRRATAAAVRWRPQLGSLWRLPRAKSYLLAAIPLFIAVLVLESPARNELASAGNDGPPGSQTTAGHDDALFDVASGLTEVREAIIRGATDDNGLPESGELAGRNAPQIADADAVSQDSEQVDINGPDGLHPGVASATDEAGPLAGDARRGASDNGQASDGSRARFSARVETAIERRGAAAAGRSSGNDDFPAGMQAPGSGSLVMPAPAPPALTAWTSLTPAEVAYARRYLDAVGHTND